MTDAPKTVTAAVLIIGNEILSGRTKDANLPFLVSRRFASAKLEVFLLFWPWGV